ncbi:hypothetical protein C8R48DRAFT_280939 [Suillus tomentosus]|nr:hypothetical protein C8R48DRAFT_280939 [Suillus tomentosus]
MSLTASTLCLSLTAPWLCLISSCTSPASHIYLNFESRCLFHTAQPLTSQIFPTVHRDLLFTPSWCPHPQGSHLKTNLRFRWPGICT